MELVKRANQVHTSSNEDQLMRVVYGLAHHLLDLLLHLELHFYHICV